MISVKVTIDDELAAAVRERSGSDECADVAVVHREYGPPYSCPTCGDWFSPFNGFAVLVGDRQVWPSREFVRQRASSPVVDGSGAVGDGVIHGDGTLVDFLSWLDGAY